VIPFWSSPRSGRWRKGGSLAVLTLGGDDGVGKAHKWGREKRVPGVVWRRCDARGPFYTAGERERRR
jgi:hypothetical protein